MTSNTIEMTFWQHFEELIRHLRATFYAIIVSVFFVLFFPVGFNSERPFGFDNWYPTISSWVITRIQKDFLPQGVELIPISWYAPLQVSLYVSLVLGVIFSLPIIIYNFYQFVNPALHSQEKKSFFPFIFSFSVLFTLGFFLGYFFVIPTTIKLLFLSAQSFDLAPRYEFAQFYSLIAGGLLISGFVMTLPVFLVLLVKLGVIGTEQVKANRKYFYGLILVAISILDPDPTLVTEMFLGIPVIIAFEIAIKLASRWENSLPK